MRLLCSGSSFLLNREGNSPRRQLHAAVLSLLELVSAAVIEEHRSRCTETELEGVEVIRILRTGRDPG